MRQSLQLTYTLIIGLLLSTHSQAQVIPIREARSMGEGATVRISGVLTNGSELDVIRYIQDESGGLAIYDVGRMGATTTGDSVTISGKLVDYNGLLEIQPVDEFTLEKQGAILPEAEQLKPSELGEYYECMLVEIRNATFDLSGASFMSGSNYAFHAGSENGEIRIGSQSSPLVGKTIPSGNVNITGILSQYRNTYQVLPRTEADISASEQIGFSSPPVLTDLKPQGFTMEWETTLEGSTELVYGSGPDLGLGLHLEGTEGRQHKLSVDGASASELIYVQVFSVDAEDTARSAIIPIMTQSLSSGSIRAWFNRPADHSLAMETEAVHVFQALDDSIVALIDRAEESVDFCAYNLNAAFLADIPGALNAAHARGVRVRVIYDSNQSNLGIPKLNPGIGKMASPKSSYPDYGIMHNKFVLIDARSDDPMKPLVWTGSTNFTTDQMLGDPNNVVLIQDQSLALTYEMEFNEMFGSSGAQANKTAARFGPDKLDNTPHHFLIGDTWVDCWFSPSDNTNARILEALQSADADLSIATMLITRDDLAATIRERSKAGVDTRMLVKDRGSCSEEALNILLPSLQEDFRTGGEAGMMHHKYAVVDQGLADSDPLVLTGSHNWSTSAEVRNDENTLVIHDQDLANQFYQEFAMRFGAGIVSVPPMEIETEAPLSLYPNPARSHVWVQVTGKSIREKSSSTWSDPGVQIRILDLSGRIIKDVHFPSSPEGRYQIKLEGLGEGYYLLQFGVGKNLEYTLPLVLNPIR